MSLRTHQSAVVPLFSGLLTLVSLSGCVAHTPCVNERCVCLACETPSTSSATPLDPYDVDVTALVAQSSGTWAIELQGTSETLGFDMIVSAPLGDASGPYGPVGILYPSRNPDPCNAASTDSCIDLAIPVNVTFEPMVGSLLDSLRPLHYDSLVFTGADEEAAQITLLQLGRACTLQLHGDGHVSGTCTGSDPVVVTGVRQ